MKRLGPSYLWLVGVAVPATVLAVSACASESAPPGATGGASSGTGGSVSTGGTSTGTTGGTSTGTTGGTSTTTGGVETAGTTGTGGAGGGMTSTGGSGGTGVVGPKVKLCATKTTLTIPLMTNFDSYDGMTAADVWSFPFNGTAADPGVPYAGPYTYNDMTGTPFIGMVGGAAASTYAISISNPMASGWGGALAFWMGCADASSFKGISFNARGTIPTGTVSVTLTMEQSSPPDAVDPAGGGTCDAATACKAPEVSVPVTPDWQLIQIPWSMFTPGVGSAMAPVAPTGDNIAGFAFSVGLVYMESPAGSMMYVATPAPYQLDLDDLGFY